MLRLRRYKASKPSRIPVLAWGIPFVPLRRQPWRLDWFPTCQVRFFSPLNPGDGSVVHGNRLYLSKSLVFLKIVLAGDT
jgi:hypothetical protein